ncbi:Major facilitator superfamily domain, general substrate transporter [Penicillium griseofulvum]|uniref:Major facilitator superfamily domain, general substrate transporter n=1 Tax=Penicillium patulum TaxID=5078 RepID=A0A135LUI4_PENPA|nr:Major facilitator superfamily domain, general substrate transporter [Penicillium griseofulvum]KXG52615.1 Major facilitator superfamily domain, general substrate transporter [Penicillium griseofulvum]
MQAHASLDNFPPGTILLIDRNTPTSETILSPTPSDHPDDPLNWSSLRKAVNFGLTCTYVLFTFVLIDVNSLVYRGYIEELGLTYATLNDASGSNFAGLAVGCLLLVPCVHKYGRRPLYLISATVQFACAIWWANIHHGEELIAVSLLAGLSGSISEAIVMITVADLFFLHQHARMNGIFIFMQSLGATGGPIAAGYVITSMGWRWMWWMIAIFLGVNLLLVLFFFEESKYIPTFKGQFILSKDPRIVRTKEDHENEREPQSVPSHLSANSRPSRKSYSQRLALVTKTDQPILQHFYQPFIVFFTFPAVAFTALSFGSILAWFSANASAGSYFLIYEPYNFGPSAIGLFHLGGFVGCLFATFTAPFFNDWLIIWLARRNEGIFEPEMRLWMMIPAAVLNAIGLLVFGIGLGRGFHWIILAAGQAFFGFGFIVTADAALTYLNDCYPQLPHQAKLTQIIDQILGDALVAVVFVRNGFAMVIRFSFTSWLTGMGIQHTFVLIGVIAFATMIMPILLLVLLRVNKSEGRFNDIYAAK